MSARPQGSELVEIVSPEPTVLMCSFPLGFKLHGCVQNVVHLQVEERQIILIRHPSDVLNDIFQGLQAIHRETKLIASGKVERNLLELHVCSAELLGWALAPVVVAINANKPLQATYTNRRVRQVAAFA